MRSPLRRRAYFCAALLSGTLSFGTACTQKPSETLLPVKGRITVDNLPVHTGNVTFYPDTPKGQGTRHQPTGILDEAGNYELFVTGGKKGAPPGWYKVVVYAVDDPQPGKPNKYLVNKKYADVDTTTLRIEVSANPEPGRYDFKLTP